MLVHQSTLLAQAREEGYALGSFDVLSIDYALGALDAAERLKSPIVLSVADVHSEYIDFDVLGAAVMAAAQRAVVPVVVHLDHSKSLGLVSRALRLGFNSVMYDGSGEPWDQHVGELKVIVAMAHDAGATVEASLSEGSRGATGNPQNGEWALPPADLAAEFVEATGIDVLAIGEGSSTFDPDRVSALTALSSFATLHGGSQLSDKDLAFLIDRGVVKCCVFGAISKAGAAAVRDYLAAPNALAAGLGPAARAGYERAVAAQIERFGSANRV